MKETFAAGATRLAGLMPRLLGWPPGELWRATPAELAAILDPDTGDQGAVPLTRNELDKLLEQDRDG